jgi:hypothetical protein
MARTIIKGTRELADELAAELVEVADASKLDSATVAYSLCAALAFMIVRDTKSPDEMSARLGSALITLSTLLLNEVKVK